jgi:L-threonylcarbamoyladenylate synthase
MVGVRARVLSVDPQAPQEAVVHEAAEVLARGGLVAFPTETVYGLGARGLHGSEVGRIFTAKRRPSGHPLILHVDGEAMARSLAREWPPIASRLVGELWPGPLTVVVPRASVVPLEVTGGLDTVGLRAPRHPVALALIRAVGEPLAAPSANAHMHVSPTTAGHVVRSLGDAVDLILDAGPCAEGIESTVLELTGTPRVLRPGALPLSRLRAIEPAIAYEAVTAREGEARPSPGLASKHYAPRARVVVAAPSAVDAAVAHAARAGAKVAAVVVGSAGQSAAPRLVLPASPEGYARGLYAALHAVDEAGSDVVVIEDVPSTDPAWWAVVDRLTRAKT